MARARQVLYHTRPGERVDRAGDQFFTSATEGTPRSQAQGRSGVDHFMVRRTMYSTLYSTLGFWVHRIDGTDLDFSFVQCISLSSAERALVSAQRELAMVDV